MRFLFTSYVNSPVYQDPEVWLRRIEAYTGILKALANSHEVISIEHISYEGIVKRDSVTYQFLNTGKNFHRSPFSFHQQIKQHRPDIVFINGFNFPLQVLLLKLTLGKQAGIIVLHRAERPFSGIKKWFQIIADRCVYAYLFSSNEFTEAWKKNITTGKIHEVIQASSVFYHSDKKNARRNVNIEDNLVVFLWVGNLNPGKDPATVVRAFIDFRRLESNARLYMIFQSVSLLPEITRLIKLENAENSIILVGKIEHQGLNDWYNAADFIVSGSHYEGSGIAIVEAMSCGCIPIVTNITSFRRMTGPGKCGFLFEPGNPADLLEKLVDTKHIDIDKESIKAFQQFQTELSFEAIAKKINCITGQFDPCQPHLHNPGLAS